LYEELEQVFDKFPKYRMKILLDFTAKVGREDIFKPSIGNESPQIKGMEFRWKVRSMLEKSRREVGSVVYS
jgi:hypothetical protein